LYLKLPTTLTDKIDCDNRAVRAQQYQNNREEIQEKCAQYYQDNIEEINKKRSEKFNCVCGSIGRHGDKAKHFKSIKHQEFIKKNITV
jgi:hypothetical protein